MNNVSFLATHRRYQIKAALLALSLLALTVPAQALTFVFNATAETPLAVQNDFAAAGARWATYFSDPVTVYINIDFKDLGSNILGQAGSSLYYDTYTDIRGAMAADVTSAADATAVGSLSAGSYGKLVNGTVQHPGLIPVYDNNGSINNSYTIASQANLKALGYTGFGTAADANITFSSTFGWDYDPTDGITAGLYDLVGVATHEIGHALGFFSTVDWTDTNYNLISENTANSLSNTLDLFRYTNYNGNIYRDATIGDASRERYFSIDGGVTDLGAFATGQVYGDGRQASHWKDNLGLGIMDPTAAAGEGLQISWRDLEALDVIGWDKASVPDSGPGLAFAATLASLMAFRTLRSRRQQA